MCILLVFTFCLEVYTSYPVVQCEGRSLDFGAAAGVAHAAPSEIPIAHGLLYGFLRHYLHGELWAHMS